MCSHRTQGVNKRSAVLDFQSLNCIRIITGPPLRRIIDHPRIKATSPGSAKFKKNFRKLGCQTFIKVIDAEHVTMEHLTLSPGRKARRISLSDAAVHIPFHIRNFGLAQYLGNHGVNMIDYFRAGEIKDILVAPVGNRSSRCMDDPIRMGPEKITIRVHHFRLEP